MSDDHINTRDEGGTIVALFRALSTPRQIYVAHESVHVNLIAIVSVFMTTCGSV